MEAGISAWSWVDKLFLACALLGGGLFVLRTALMLIGADHGADMSAEVSADVHVDVSSADATHDLSSVASFKLLTFQGISAFILMFGLVGLVLRSLHLGGLVATVGGLAVGLATMYLVARFFSMLIGLQSSGTLEAKNALGQDGTVYLRIPPGGTGKVQVTVQGRLEEFEAMSESPEEIKSGEKVRVVFIKGNVLVVEKI